MATQGRHCLWQEGIAAVREKKKKARKIILADRPCPFSIDNLYHFPLHSLAKLPCQTPFFNVSLFSLEAPFVCPQLRKWFLEGPALSEAGGGSSQLRNVILSPSWSDVKD